MYSVTPLNKHKVQWCTSPQQATTLFVSHGKDESGSQTLAANATVRALCIRETEMRRHDWILQRRETIKKYQRACAGCMKRRGKPVVQRMTDLPSAAAQASILLNKRGLLRPVHAENWEAK